MAEENLQVEKTSEQVFDFVEQLRALQTSDKGHPDTFNPLFQNLIQNDLYLRQKVELLQGLIDELERDIADTINIDLTTLKQHLDNRSNPHNVTADQLGLGNISNYSIATTPEAQQGVVNTKYMTPLRTKEAIQYMAPSKADFTGHIENRNNPHGVTVGQIGAIPTSHSSYRNWIWSGQPGQPQWMWGGNTPGDIYVYNPSNFNVRRSVFSDYLGTQNAEGGSHGEGLPLYCRHNVFGDGRFGVKVDGHETRVDYATSANNVGGYDINGIKELINDMTKIYVPSYNVRHSLVTSPMGGRYHTVVGRIFCNKFGTIRIIGGMIKKATTGGSLFCSSRKRYQGDNASYSFPMVSKYEDVPIGTTYSVESIDGLTHIQTINPTQTSDADSIIALNTMLHVEPGVYTFISRNGECTELQICYDEV